MYALVHQRAGRAPEVDGELFDDLTAARVSADKHDRIFAAIEPRCRAQVYELRKIEGG